jgi:hypothetical protein
LRKGHAETKSWSGLTIRRKVILLWRSGELPPLLLLASILTSILDG